MSILYILLLVFILGIIILIHELGHFYFAKKYGVYIYEFSIGMGPVVYSKKGKDGITYNIRAIPLGGFVAMAGEVFEDGDEDIPTEDYMCNKKWYQRVLILVAGVVNNFILAIVILFFIALCFGGTTANPVIESLDEGFPAEASGLEVGDEIVEINSHAVTSWDNAQIIMVFPDEDEIYDFTVIKADTGKKVTYELERADKEGQMVFGFSVEVVEYSGFLDSIVYGFVKFGNIVSSMFFTLYALFTGLVGVSALSGPIGMYEVVKVSAAAGFANIIYLIAFLSINVGILNILPFPAFDGGRILFLFIEKIKGSPVDQKFENICHYIGFIFLILLSIYVAFNDIIRML